MTLQAFKRLSYPFIIGLALFVVCLIYIPQWRHYAPSVHQTGPIAPYLTPWTVAFVTALSMALALIAAPFRTRHPIQIIVSKTLSVLVVCLCAVFLLEYACGIRVPDLDIFFLPDSSGQRATLYAARPSPQSSTTSLLFASSLLLFHPSLKWRKRAFYLAALAALVLPTVACFGYILDLFFPPSPAAAPRIGLSLPAVILYFTFGSGVLGLSLGSKVLNPAVTRSAKISRRLV